MRSNGGGDANGTGTFFIEYLKIDDLFEPWVASCPLSYRNINAQSKRDVLGWFLLSFLSGHNRYAHMACLLGDTVNKQLLGMSKVVSDDLRVES